MSGEPGDVGGPATTIDPVIRRIARATAVPSLTTGDVIADTYELGERLGAGGMGTVYRARDRRLDRAVAVKVLRIGTGAAADHTRRLFEREARATAQLLHPNIMTLHQVGEHAGVPYLVLELLTGETLAARLARRGKINVADAFALVDSVLAALAFAHDRGVVHRDLKPNNVFVTVDDRIKVLDFGLALDLDAPDAGPVTRAAGTPGYMAPEQREGGIQDTRTDVWAAALLLVECLTGRRCEDDELAPAIASLEVPVAVRAQLSAALATDPEQRPRTAGELRAALQHASAKLVPLPKPPSRWKKRAAIAALIAASAGAGALAAVALRSSPPASPAREELAGTWTLNFGTMLFEVAPDGTAYGVYDHDTGVLVGHYKDGLMVGRWCELPTRRAPADAGVIQLQFARGKLGPVVEGRWAYGDVPDTTSQTEPLWHTGQSGFFGERVEVAPPPTLVERFAQHVVCP